MELLKSNDTPYGSMLNKFVLKCDEHKDKWFNLIKLLYKSSTNNTIILLGLYDKKIDIVLKVSFQEFINKEYDIAQKLKHFPNFINYYCKFLCNDDIMNIINNQYMLTNYKICNVGNKPIGILTMDYYSIGSIGLYPWNKENFYILKNVLKQTVFAILYAYENIGFIHGDLHSNNILLCETTNKNLMYGVKKLEIIKYEIKIMDFEKSKIDLTNEYKYVIDNIQKLFNSVCDSNSFSIKVNYKNNLIRKKKSDANLSNAKTNSITLHDYEDFEKMIDNFYIEY